MNKLNIKKICVIGVLTALSVVLIFFIHFRPFPGLMLEYDAGDIPIFLCTYLYGPIYGITIGVIASFIQYLTVSADATWIGLLMHLFSIVTYTLIVGFLYYKNKSTKRLIIAAVIGVAAVLVVMILWNFIFTPIFYNAPIEAVFEMMPFLIIFNIMKPAINSFVAILLYKILNQKIFNKLIG